MIGKKLAAAIATVISLPLGHLAGDTVVEKLNIPELSSTILAGHIEQFHTQNDVAVSHAQECSVRLVIDEAFLNSYCERKQ